MNDYSYADINVYNSLFSPSTVHCRNTELVRYFSRYLLNKVLGTYELTGLPEHWYKNYVQYVLFCMGYIAVLDTDIWGVIPQNCTLGGYDVQYQPQYAIITNPKFKQTYELFIGEDTEVIRLLPDYHGILDIVAMYADMMALALETAGVNLVNSKFSYIFGAANEAQAQTFKKMYDNIQAGDPAAFVAKKDLYDINGNPNWMLFSQNVGQNYITDKVLNDLKTIEDQFNTKMGIPNANTQKRERLITDEVNANNADTSSIATLIVENVSETMAKVNDMFGLDLGIKYRWEVTGNEQESIYND